MKHEKKPASRATSSQKSQPTPGKKQQQPEVNPGKQTPQRERIDPKAKAKK